MDSKRGVGRWHAYYRSQSLAARRQFWLVVFLVVAALVAASMLRFTEEDITVTGSQDEKLVVLVEEIQPRSIRPEYRTSGVVQVPVPVSIIPQVSGRVVEMSPECKVGSEFAPEQVLFRIDSRDYETMRVQAEAALRQAETSLELAQADTATAREEWRRLNPNEAVPDLVARKPQLVQARSAVAAAKADLQQAALTIERTAIAFPFAGSIEDLSVGVGQYLQAGQSYGAVYPSGGLEVKVPIQKNKVKYFPSDISEAVIRFNEMTLTVAGARTGAVLDPATRFLDMYFTLTEEQQRRLGVLPGAFVEVVLHGAPVEPAYRLPAESFFDGRHVLFVRDGRLERFAPEILTRGPDFFVTRGDDKPLLVVRRKPFGAGPGMRVEVEYHE